jgi:hypothetical protein
MFEANRLMVFPRKLMGFNRCLRMRRKDAHLQMCEYRLICASSAKQADNTFSVELNAIADSG